MFEIQLLSLSDVSCLEGLADAEVVASLVGADGGHFVVSPQAPDEGVLGGARVAPHEAAIVGPSRMMTCGNWDWYIM